MNRMNIEIVQLCHGKIIPAYSSAYALRVRRYLSSFKSRVVFSVSGLVFHDEEEDDAVQYRSLLMTVVAYLKGNRALEILLSKGSFLRGKYLTAAIERVSSAKIIIFEGPWQFYLFREKLGGKIVIYDSHNIEFQLRKGNQWENYTFELERDLVNRSDMIITVTESDREEMINIYNISGEKIICIPEGFQSTSQKWSGLTSKEFVFIGSAYLPNIEAVHNLLLIAKELPDFKFKIIGSVCDSIKKRGAPKNVDFLGIVDENRKEKEICNSLAALNPVTTGSGRNLKMNDYISYGIPIITTEVGARGFERQLKDHFIISDISGFPESINGLMKTLDTLSAISAFFIKYAENNNYNATTERAYEEISYYLFLMRCTC